jgi:thiamine-monophosphate kinase
VAAHVPLDELTIIERFLRPLAGEGALGLLDDAASLRPPAGCDLVLTTDAIAEGVHFLADDPPGTVAQKALRVNLSDLAAKGAAPLGYLLTLALPGDATEEWLTAFVAGLAADQEEFGIALLGGDTIATPGPLTVSIAAIGSVPAGRVVPRSGGRPGDLLFVSGTLGGAAAGLALLQGEEVLWRDASPRDRDRLVDRYRVPEPRMALAPVLRAHASAAMDLSDGLVGDCDKLAAASGCGASIDAGAVPLDPALALFSADAAVLARVITAGDDYEILAAIPPEREASFLADADAAGLPVRRIGTLVAGPGPVQVKRGGRPLQLARRGYVHAAGRAGR